MAQDMLNPLPTGERKEVVEGSNMIPSPLGERVRVSPVRSSLIACSI
jgi:hypothetical protein